MFKDKSSLVYFNNFTGLIKSGCFRMETFVDSSSRSLKVVLLHDGNIFSSILVGHSVQMKNNNSIDHLLSAVNYQDHKWLISGDLKVVGWVLGFQGEYTKYPCFLCFWASWANKLHYVRQEWPLRQGLKPGLHNIQSLIFNRIQSI